jgi:hypothetical protein
MENQCELCDGRLALLGFMGRFVWFRCINCGCECSVEANNFDEIELDEMQQALEV